MIDEPVEKLYRQGLQRQADFHSCVDVHRQNAMRRARTFPHKPEDDDQK